MSPMPGAPPTAPTTAPIGTNATTLSTMQHTPSPYPTPQAFPGAPPNSTAPVPAGAPAGHQGHRPLPGADPRVAAVANGVGNMSMSGYAAPTGAAGPPSGMRAVQIGDAASLPRPDLSGTSVAARVAGGDPVPQPPPDATSTFPDPITGKIRPRMSVDPAACPTEIFVPCSPRAVRLCNASFPKTKSLSTKYALPLGAIVQPLATPGPDEEPVPVVNFGTTGVVRCKRCRAYISFASSFRDGGRRWICCLCSFSNECPSDYFSPLDQNGKRRDAAERPELHRGSVEFVAPAEYMVRPPMPPVYLFVLETTPAAINSGMLALAIAGIKKSIDSMPNEGRTRVGIITFDSAVQFYSLRSGEDAQPAVYIVSDINEVFLPTPDEVLVQLSECRPCFERALDMIATTYSASNGMLSAASCFGAALQGAQKAMEYVGGKIIAVLASRPTSGPGSLRDRGDNANLNTDKERAVLRPETTFYRDLAVNYSKYQISCDLFVCPPPPAHFLDIAALAQIAKFTGGELFYSPNFEAPKDGPRLQLAINRTLARETGLEAVMRIRATKRVRCTRFSGRFFSRATDLLAMPNVDADKAYAVQFAFDEAIIEEGPFVMQVALLYTNTSGERRIRVHTLAVPLADNPGDLFLRADAAAITNIFARQAAEGMKDRVLEELRSNTNEKMTAALSLYRDVCQRQYPPVVGNNQLLLPESLLLLPLYLHGLGKSPILSRDASGACMFRFDDKSALAHAVDVMNVSESTAMVYPNMMAVYPWPSLNNQPVKHPHGLPASVGALRSDIGVTVDDGRSLTVWLGEAIAEKFTSELLGTTVSERIDPRYLTVELMRRGASAKGAVGQVYGAVTSILRSRRAALPLMVAPQGDRFMQPRIESLMTEDRSASRMAYREFLLEVQKTVAQKSSRR